MNPLISPDQTWALWAILLATAALGLWAERTRWGARLSGAVITLVAAFALSNLGLIPAATPVYSNVWSYLVPLAIPLLLFHTDLRHILRESGATLIAFVIGAVGIVIGTVVAFYTVPLGEQAWQLATVFSATYIGGAMNYRGAAEAVGLPAGDLFTAGIAAANLMMTLSFLLLFTLPAIRSLRMMFNEPVPDRWASTAEVVDTESRKGTSIHLPSITTALALSAAIATAGYFLETWLGLAGIGILIIAVIAVLLATALPGPMARLRGANEVGILLMQILFAVIGASANIAVVFKAGPLLFLFCLVILIIHLATILIGGKLARLSLPEIVIASNANMGGPTTAVAMAVARRWQPFYIPAILCGTLGYVTATFIGTTLGNWLR